MIKFLPNTLTILRVVSIPIFLILSLGGRPIIALFVYIFACITDYYDGNIARKYGIVSNFGKLMDPLADKLLVLSALLLLSIPPISYIHWSIIIIIAFREIAVSILRQYYQNKNIIIEANKWGKIKTVVQMTGIITALVVYTALSMDIFKFLLPFENGLIVFLKIYFWITAVITIISGANYFFYKTNS